MNQTLQATRTTVVYDEFSLKLYFLAKDVLKEAVHISVTVQPGMTVSLFRNPAHFDLNASQSSVGVADECMKPSSRTAMLFSSSLRIGSATALQLSWTAFRELTRWTSKEPLRFWEKSQT